MKKLAVTALIEREGLFLGVARREDPNDFGLPGGKVEAGEGLVEALIREVFEETGMRITFCEPVFERVDEDFLVTCYKAVAVGEPAQPEGEGVVKWVTAAELCAGCFGVYNKNLLASLGYIA